MPADLRTTIIHRARHLWYQYGIFWMGAVVVGILAVFYARLIDLGFNLFHSVQQRHAWSPLILTPAIAAASVWLTRRFFRGSEGSGIPQVIATLHAHPGESRSRLLTLRILIGKIAVSFLGILGGFTIGREGPTIQVGAALMLNLRRFYPHSHAHIERQLVLAGGAAGLAAAFNAPLAGIVFAIEELAHGFESRASSVVISAIVIAGVIALGLNGNYTYFGTIQIGADFPGTLVLAVLLTAIVTGIAGGVFCWLLLNTARWMPAPVRSLRENQPVAFGALCGLIIAVVGLASHSATFGSGYAEARGLLYGSRLPFTYPFLKMIAMVGSYLPGIPGGLFAPSLAIGAGFGNLLHSVFGDLPVQALIAMAMVGYLAAVTQSPITAFVIVIEMINNHMLVISLMATALLAARVSAFFTKPLYEALSLRYHGQTMLVHAASAGNTQGTHSPH